jgi:hypothetical protein
MPNLIKTEPIYHFKKTRAQRSIVFFSMSASCALYAAGLFVFESVTGEHISSDFKFQWVLGCTLIGLILSAVGVWHMRNPATYEAKVTDKQFSISYPFSESLSFCVLLDDIVRFEYRQSVGHAGSGIPRHGIFMRSGQFHDISMNYGNNINDMHKAVTSIKPNIPFYKKTDGRGHGRL